jgi:hypothetical protein
MASHAHRPSYSGGANITAVVVALITTIGGITGLVLTRNSSDSGGPPTVPTTSVPMTSAAAITQTPTTTSLANGARNTGLRFSPLTNGKLTVSGSADKDVIGMWVMIGPKSSPDVRYDAGCGNVVNGLWQTEVTTDASWQNYPLVTQPTYDSCVVATSASAFKFTFQLPGTTTVPPPSPDQILDCVKQNGPSCFSGPGFGPPTTYEPNQ